MKENKTKATGESIADYIAAIPDAERRKDCAALARLMEKATTEKPKMRGTSIVGFGSDRDKYDSGREGDSCVAGFSSRKGDISIDVVADFPGMDKRLAKPGKHKPSGGCLSIRRLADVDLAALERLVAGAARERKRLHG